MMSRISTGIATSPQEKYLQNRSSWKFLLKFAVFAATQPRFCPSDVIAAASESGNHGSFLTDASIYVLKLDDVEL
jgi:hypothetical protein